MSLAASFTKYICNRLDITKEGFGSLENHNAET